MTKFQDVANNKKSPVVRQKIAEALQILEAAGVPFQDLTKRRLEKMAMCFLAVANIDANKNWSSAAKPADAHILKTRDIIKYINDKFAENISSGSYDDIRRRDLLRPVQMELIIKSANKEDADTNDGTRGYGISPKLSTLARAFGTDKWEETAKNFKPDQEYIDAIEGRRDVPKLKVLLPDGAELLLDDGPHNQIQKAVVEEFLPRYGYGSQVLYIADTADKKAVKNDASMKSLGLDVADRGMLPDIVAFSPDKSWLYLIEAVHSSNPLNPERCIELRRTVLRDCPHGVVFVTAFLTRKDFAKWSSDLAWETEVWIADNPDHMIHFNGDKFLGPHNQAPRLS